MFEDEVTTHDGWLWPAHDSFGFPAIIEEAKEIHRVIEHCRAFDVAVQAGGNCGIMVTPLADAFARVYTFEPDPLNFYCLANNCQQPNVYKLQACLGDMPGTVSLMQHQSNTAAHYLAAAGMRGPVPMMLVDQLNLPACDLLMLDVEGFELQALKGAEATLAKFKPALCVELIGHGTRYGVSDDTVRSWLKWAGYKEVDRLLRDSIFIPY